MPRDTLQLFAAKELYSREWKYHKKMQLWFTQPDDNVMKSLGYKADSLVYFDTEIWERRVFLNDGSVLQFMTLEEIQSQAA
jgi:CCR4-NOT transcription complex subunit 2